MRRREVGYRGRRNPGARHAIERRAAENIIDVLAGMTPRDAINAAQVMVCPGI